MVSTETSVSSLVMPVRVRSTGFPQRGDRNHDLEEVSDRARGAAVVQMRLPPVTMPGLYLSVVPVSLISTFMPFVSLSRWRSSDAS